VDDLIILDDGDVPEYDFHEDFTWAA